MDLQHAVGRLITGRVPGYELTDDIASLIAAGIISGITLFQANGQNLGQLATLIDSLHKQAGTDTEFLVSVDQEGGAVQRFAGIIAPMPSAMALAALDDQENIDRLVALHAQQLALLGIGCNLVPVLDVNSNPLNPIIATRSYGDNPERIVAMGRKIAGIYLRAGVLAAGKHFPGHGDTAKDTHMEMVAINGDLQTLKKRELLPFQQCLDSLPAILVAHVWVKALDERCLPASLSKNVIDGLLRREMKFDGFVMTDDMPCMKAISDNWGLEEASIMAVNAGVDHLLMCGTAEQVSSVHTALIKAVNTGMVSEKQILAAIERRKVAASWIKPSRESLSLRIDRVEATMDESRALCQSLSVASILHCRGLIPRIESGSCEWLLVIPDHPRYRMDLLGIITEKLAFDCQAAFRERRYTMNPSADEIAEIVTFARGKNCIFLSYRSLLYKAQQNLSQQLSAVVAQPSLLVATDVPYDVAALPEWENAIAIFDPSDQGINGLAALLTSNVQPQGRSPVRLNNLQV